MKVALVGPYPGPGMPITGGVERAIDTMLPELAKRATVTLVVPGAAQDLVVDNSVGRIIYLKGSRSLAALRYWTSDAKRVADLVEDIRPDIVHIQGAAGIARFLPAPMIITVHGIVHRDVVEKGSTKGIESMVRLGTSLLLRHVEARARKKIRNVVVINDYVNRTLPDIAALKTYAIPNPIDPMFVTDAADPAPRMSKRIIAVGRIDPRKNTKAIIEIAARAIQDDPAIELVLCGTATDRAYEAGCINRIRALGIEGAVRLCGNLKTRDLISELDQAALLLMASRQETAPMAIAEANARGLPALAPEDFGIPHMISPGRNGLFLPNSGIEDQARFLRYALDRDWNRSEIAQEARLTYAPERVAELTLDAYKDVLRAAR